MLEITSPIKQRIIRKQRQQLLRHRRNNRKVQGLVKRIIWLKINLFWGLKKLSQIGYVEGFHVFLVGRGKAQGFEIFEQIKIAEFKDQERIFVNFIGHQIQHCRAVFAGVGPIGARTTRMKRLPRARKQRNALALAVGVEFGRQLAVEQLREVKRVVGNEAHQTGFV